MGIFQIYLYHESVGYDWMYIAYSNELDLWLKKKVDHLGLNPGLQDDDKAQNQLMLETTTSSDNFYFVLF